MEASTLPAELVTAVLQEIKAKRPLCLCSYPLNDLSLVERLAASPAGTLSSTHLACLHGVFYFILKEFTFFQHPLTQKFDLKDLASKCEQRFDALLQTYSVLGAPSFGNILALTLGTLKAQNQCKPLQACTLISAAASHCQTLGYNHDSTHENSSNSRRLFWSVYMLEKQFSFFFGRASVMQDCDVDTVYPIYAPKSPGRPRDELFIKEVKLAKMQGRIWKEAFSKESLALSHSEREKRIETLAMELQFWYAKLPVTSTYEPESLHLFNVAVETWETKYHSTFTALLRAPAASPTSNGQDRMTWLERHITSTTTSQGSGQMHIKPECFKTARGALQSYLKCMRTYQKVLDYRPVLAEGETGVYTDWPLLSTLLTPFIAITLHSIASHSTSSPNEKGPQEEKEKDLTLLNNIVSTLDPLKSTSPATTRLYKLTSSLAKIANGLNDRRSSVSSQEDLLAFARGGSGKRQSAAASVFSFQSGSETRSLYQQVMDTDIMGILGEGEAEEVFRVLEGWMGGSLNGVEVYGGWEERL
ncbi:hypothetical protein ASPCAL00441 [Aspergillus calidoustus]|uniref:Xylanolytic transcriptional activator regulatory domain-containing protein n=1 Tax=Aspergillus calidoustus TaxID=454130 RepID=A0A0U5FUT3_ASPCI|nr:hypothetical protein ASPCAL00441 [Aspergillus calidoustus]